MAQETINIGTDPNDKTGDPLREAFNKINLNFDEIYGSGLAASGLALGSNTITSIAANSNIVMDPNGSGRVVVEGNSLTVSQRRTVANQVGEAGDTEGMIAWDNNYVYVCTGNWDGSSLIWKRSALGW